MIVIAPELKDVWPSVDVFGDGHEYDRRLNKDTFEKIKRWEKYIPTKYLDTTKKMPDGSVKKIFAIAYGHTGATGIWPSQKEIVEGNLNISLQQADEILYNDLQVFLNELSPKIKCNINNYMIGACLMLQLNMGTTKFAKTAVLENLNKGKYVAACASFLVDIKTGQSINNRASKKNTGELEMLNGLTCRRADEMSLFLTKKVKL